MSHMSIMCTRAQSHVCVCVILIPACVDCSGISYAIVSWWGRKGSSSGDSQGWVGDDAFLVQLLQARAPAQSPTL